MCVIIFKPLGATNPADDVFVTADENNPDGWGLMARVDGRIEIRRGFGVGSEKTLVEAVHEFADYEYVVHTRIGTGGTVGIGNTHPFLVHDDVWMVHNGIIDIDDTAAPQMCDSYHYAKFLESVLAHRPGGIQYEIARPEIREWMASHIGASKLVFMDGKATHIVNENKYSAFWKDGVWFSNDSAHRKVQYAGNVLVSGYGAAFGSTWKPSWQPKAKSYGYVGNGMYDWDQDENEDTDEASVWAELERKYGETEHGAEGAADERPFVEVKLPRPSAASIAREYESGLDADDLWLDALTYPSSRHVRSRAKRVRNQHDEDENFLQVLGLMARFSHSMDSDEIAQFADVEPELTADVIVHMLTLLDMHKQDKQEKQDKVIALPPAPVLTVPHKPKTKRNRKARERKATRRRFGYTPTPVGGAR